MADVKSILNKFANKGNVGSKGNGPANAAPTSQNTMEHKIAEQLAKKQADFENQKKEWLINQSLQKHLDKVVDPEAFQNLVKSSLTVVNDKVYAQNGVEADDYIQAFLKSKEYMVKPVSAAPQVKDIRQGYQNNQQNIQQLSDLPDPKTDEGKTLMLREWIKQAGAPFRQP
jgi:hypothetical protein